MNAFHIQNSGYAQSTSSCRVFLYPSVYFMASCSSLLLLCLHGTSAHVWWMDKSFAGEEFFLPGNRVVLTQNLYRCLKTK